MEYGHISINSSYVLTSNQTLGEERTSVFLAYLYDKGRKSATLKSYVSAIKSVLTDDGYIWDDNKVQFNNLTRACRVHNDEVYNRLPIQIGLLELILMQLNNIFNKQAYLLILYRTLFLLAYYGLMRVGELTSGDHPILAKDVHSARNKNKILLLLRSSKTHGKESRPQEIKIEANETEYNKKKHYFCPFKSLNEFLDFRGNYTELDEPLFIFRDGTAVKPANFRKTLKTALRLLNLDADLYDTHSFRIGRATDLLKFGHHIEKIKKIGRWKSNAVYNYLR